MRRTLLVLLLLSVAACSRQRHPGVISRRTFVHANVALRVVPDTVAHSDSLRRAALKHAGVSPAQLRAFVRAHGGNAEYMARLWKEIADSVQARYVSSGAAARDSAAAAAPPAGAVAPPAIPPPPPFNPPAPAGQPRPPLVVRPQPERPLPRPPAPTQEHPPAPAPPLERRKPPPPSDRRPMAPQPGDTLHHGTASATP